MVVARRSPRLASHHAVAALRGTYRLVQYGAAARPDATATDSYTLEYGCVSGIGIFILKKLHNRGELPVGAHSADVLGAEARQTPTIESRVTSSASFSSSHPCTSPKVHASHGLTARQN